MALRSVVDIDVNDAALDRALQKLQLLRQQAANIPPIGRLGRPGRPGGPSEEERAVPFAERLERTWGRMREHSREVVRNVREMAQRFLSLTGMLGLLTSAATLFGGLGFNALARSAGTLRNEAIGAGTTIGGLQGATIGLRRFGDMPALMSALKTGAMTPGSEQWQAMRMLGINPKPGDDSFDLLQRFLPAAREQYMRQEAQRPGSGALWWEGTPLKSLMSLQDFRQVLARSPEELQQGVTRARTIAGQTDISDKTARAFQDFTATMETAVARLKTTVINRIVELAPSLEKLSETITNLLTRAVDWALSTPNIEAIKRALEAFGKFLSEHDFKKDWERFIAALDEVTAAIMKVARFIKGVGSAVSGETGPEVPLEDQKGTPPVKGGWGLGKDWKWQWFEGTEDKDKDEAPPADPIFRKRVPGGMFAPDSFTPAAFRQMRGGIGIPVTATAPLPVEIVGFGRLGQQKAATPQPDQPAAANMLHMASFRGVANDNRFTDSEWLARIAKAESNFNPNAKSPAGAMGMMQIMPGTWAQYAKPGENPWNPSDSLSVAQRYIQHLMSLPELGGDREKVTAAYNAGEGRVIAEIRKHGEQWRSFLPPETQQYVPRVLQGAQPGPDFHPAKPPQVAVLLQNEAGGNLVVSSRQIA